MSVKDYKADGGFIETYTGRLFYLDHPEFDINDISHALAMKVRYGGHCSQFYSVAEHSVLVAKICMTEGWADPFEGLMHDAVEAYIGDMPSPIKHRLPDFKALEHRLEHQLREQFGLPSEMTPGCKRADLLALYIEGRQLLSSRGAHLFPADPDALSRYADEVAAAYPVRRLMPYPAREQFLIWFAELRTRA